MTGARLSASKVLAADSESTARALLESLGISAGSLVEKTGRYATFKLDSATARKCPDTLTKKYGRPQNVGDKLQEISLWRPKDRSAESITVLGPDAAHAFSQIEVILNKR